MEKKGKNTNISDMDQFLDELIAKRNKTDFGRAARRIGALMDMNQKEMAAKLDMTPQQLSQLLKKENWTDEQKKRISDAFNIPVQGFESLATETDLLGFYITNNTAAGGGSTIGQSNFHIYNFNNDKSDKIEDIVSELAQATKNIVLLLGKLDEKVENSKAKK